MNKSCLVLRSAGISMRWASAVWLPVSPLFGLIDTPSALWTSVIVLSSAPECSVIKATRSLLLVFCLTLTMTLYEGLASPCWTSRLNHEEASPFRLSVHALGAESLRKNYCSSAEILYLLPAWFWTDREVSIASCLSCFFEQEEKSNSRVLAPAIVRYLKNCVM